MGDLPKGWLKVKLAEVIDNYQAGFASGKKDVVNGLFHLRMNNIDSQGGVDLKLLRTVPLELAQERHLLVPNDILICTTNSAKLVGKSTIFNLNGVYAFSNHLTRLRVNSNNVSGVFLQKYLFFLWKREGFESLCKHWVNQSTIPKEKLLDIDVPLPPLNEQRRIVAKLEKLLAKVNACGDRLDKIPTILKRFRQSVLAAACSGRLTADWREKHPDVEPAEELLKRTQDQRVAKATTTAQQKKIDEIYSYKESQNSDELPPNWSYCCLEKIAYSFNYGTSTKSSPSGDVPVLRMGNLQEGVIDWSDLVFTSDTAEISKYSLEPYTVLFNRTNSPELVGKTSIYLGERPAIFAGYLIRIIHVKECLNPKYLNYFLNSLQAKEYCRKVKADGVSQSNINAQKLGKFEIPFCSLQEQEEIVRRLEALFQKCDQIEARYQKAKAYTDKLTQALLAKAFRGELVPQDPNDEPAEVLLKRIKAEKEAATTKPPKTTKKRGKKASSPQQTIPGME